MGGCELATSEVEAEKGTPAKQRRSTPGPNRAVSGFQSPGDRTAENTGAWNPERSPAVARSTLRVASEDGITFSTCGWGAAALGRPWMPWSAPRKTGVIRVCPVWGCGEGAAKVGQPPAVLTCLCLLCCGPGQCMALPLPVPDVRWR